REKTIAPYAPSDLRRVEVRGRFTLERSPKDDDFRVVENGQRASRASLEKLWTSLAELRAEAFLPDGDVESPAYVLVATPRDEAAAVAEIAIGGACPGHEETDVVVARRAPAPRVKACAPKGLIDGLARSADAIVDS